MKYPMLVEEKNTSNTFSQIRQVLDALHLLIQLARSADFLVVCMSSSEDLFNNLVYAYAVGI